MPSTEDAFSSPNLRQCSHSPEHFYRVVADVSKYREFIPWCTSSDILSTEPIREQKSIGQVSAEITKRQKASLTVGFQQFQERYVSHVTCIEHVFHRPHNYRVEARASDSALFDVLETTWEISSVPGHREQCQVRFDIGFKFKSLLHEQASNLFFEKAASAMVQAFETRAHETSHR